DFSGLLTDLVRYRSKKALAELHWKALFIGAMHFQDMYNYDIERVMRCQIHYAAPDGRIIPFCAYNAGPEFRDEIEKKFSVPLEEWKQRHESGKDAI
ncbi:MAG: radical SAM protein, partial [Candidatus Thermoplasmatota archaeon]|nr:radical SAM protein [Candidatus Thermoplasmatota archaeon]